MNTKHNDYSVIDLGPGIQERQFSDSVLDKPVSVSVIVQTYQHVNYIAQCLESICSQQTSFSYEVLVGEDCSSDGTLDVCMEMARKYQDKIRLICHDRSNNIKIFNTPTGRFNFMTNIKHARGKYIAICEGDDFWKDDQKLQKQFDFLECNEDFAIAFHDAVFVNENNEGSLLMLGEANHRHRTQKHVVRGAAMPTASVMLHRSHLAQLPSCFPTVMNADTFMFAFCGQFGKAGYVDVKPSGYRVHSGGIWSGQQQLFKLKCNLHTFRTLCGVIKPDLRPQVQYQTHLIHKRMFGALLRQGQLKALLSHLTSWVSDAFTFGVGRTVLSEARWLASSVARLLKLR